MNQINLFSLHTMQHCQKFSNFKNKVSKPLTSCAEYYSNCFFKESGKIKLGQGI